MLATVEKKYFWYPPLITYVEERRRTVSTQLTLIFESKYNLVLVEFRPTLVVSSFVKQKKRKLAEILFTTMY